MAPVTRQILPSIVRAVAGSAMLRYQFHDNSWGGAELLTPLRSGWERSTRPELAGASSSSSTSPTSMIRTLSSGYQTTTVRENVLTVYIDTQDAALFV